MLMPEGTESSSSAGDWRKLAAAKRNEIAEAIPIEWRITNIPSPEKQRDVTGAYIQQYLTEREVEITEQDAVGIVEKTTTGQWTAVEVAKAFCHRAAIAQQLTNCLHEVFFDAAIKNAEELDKYFADNGKPKGMLHGLPVSLKDQFHIRDVDTSMGYIGWLGTFEGNKDDPRYRTFESEMVKELRALGAVLYVKTSVPHTLMCGETINNIIGYTMGCKNRLLSSGGSSGGEGALIGCKGSPVGFGTDIGGSIRIPSAFNGLFGIRPTAGRMPYEGMANSMDGQNAVLSTTGPLANSIRSLRLVMQGLLSQQPWLHDPLAHAIPWRSEEEVLPKKLCFGVMRTNGRIGVTSPIRRALDITIQALQSQGHEIIEWQPGSLQQDIEQICNEAWVLDGNKNLNDAMDLGGEPMAPQIGRAFGTRHPQKDATEVAALNKRRREALKRYMEAWNETVKQTETSRPMDAIIAPCAPFPAAKPGCFYSYAYTTWVNVLDYTSVVIPVTEVDAKVDLVDKDYDPLNETDKLCHESCKSSRRKFMLL